MGGVIAAKRTGRPPGRRKGCRKPPGSGRKRGSRSALLRGEVHTLKIAAQLSDKMGESDPGVRACMDRYMAIVDGLPGWGGRYIGAKLHALDRAMDRALGKPVQPVAHSGKVGFTLSELLSGKPDAPPDSTD